MRLVFFIAAVNLFIIFYTSFLYSDLKVKYADLQEDYNKVEYKAKLLEVAYKSANFGCKK